MNAQSERAITELASKIVPVGEDWRTAARSHLDALTKPLGSLGRLEDLAAQIVAIREGKIDGPDRQRGLHLRRGPRHYGRGRERLSA